MSEEDSVSSSQLFNHIYEACNKIFGKVPKEAYKSYIIPLLFFKRVSDIYDEEYQEALDFSGNDEVYASMPTIHKFIIPEGCHWNDVRNKTENIGYAIFNVFGQKAMDGSSRGTISVAGLEKGVYFLQVKGENFCETAKFVVK